MSAVGHVSARQRRSKRTRARGVLPVVVAVALGCLAAGVLAHALMSRWPSYALAPDAPSMPVSIGGVVFNVPPAAIRNRVQRRAGAHERVDLAFLWPSLAPPAPRAQGTAHAAPHDATASAAGTGERVYVTITGNTGPLAPAERLQVIYPRYAESTATAGHDGLAILPFRQGTPYQGEDLIYEATTPEQFLVRCTRRAGAAPGTCLSERRIGAADVTVRFPRDWLDDWREVKAGVERLIASLRPAGN